MTLVIGIVGILLILSLAAATNAMGRSALRSAETVLVQTLRRAQILAQTNVGGARWGIYICVKPSTAECVSGGTEAPASVILFKRSAFVTWDKAADEVFEVNAKIVFTDSTDPLNLYHAMKTGHKGLAFTQIAGEPRCDTSACAGDIILSLNNEQRKMTVNAKGVVEH